MKWEFVVGLVVAVPLILLPVAYLWYLNISGILKAVQKAYKKETASEESVVAEEQTTVVLI
jgi:hypothetical protein